MDKDKVFSHTMQIKDSQIQYKKNGSVGDTPVEHQYIGQTDFTSPC